MPPLPFGVARIPVLHGRVFDLGVVKRDQLDHRGVQLVLVAHRRGAAFEVGNVGALVGDDQRALELAGVLLVDAEIGRELHRAAHARRHVDERAVGEHRRIERREEVVGHRHDRAEILLHQLGMLADRLRHRQKMTPAFASSSLKVVTTETLSNTASTATRSPRLFATTGKDLLLAQRNAELLVGAQDFRIDLVERLQRRVRSSAPSSNRAS